LTDLRLWRAFPWDRNAPAGGPFSPSFVPRPTGRGRFDLPLGASPTLYLAESPEHAIGELIQPWRGRTVGPLHLERSGHAIALVEVGVAAPEGAISDLCDPAVLASAPAGPDRVASRHRSITQPIARAIWDAGHAGLRWWSSFWGDWHTVVLFSARLRRPVRVDYGTPARLTLDTPALVDAARLLGIGIRA
jgi:hypothetical protein